MTLIVPSALLLAVVTVASGQYEFKLVPEESAGNFAAGDHVLRTANDVSYHFFSRRHPTNSVLVKTATAQLLALSDFAENKDTLFIIHGWRSSNESSVNYKIKEAILSRNDINVFVVDWSPIAGQSYSNAQSSVVRVGQYIAEFVRRLNQLYRLNISKVKFVGHSLGAHIAGNAGAALNGQVDRIVGLDPAGPSFTVNNINNRLDATDAKFVSVIHTNGGLLGFGHSMGHADYWPNGGKSQPGCGLDLVGSCAHSRAYAFYAESLSGTINFAATRCTSYSDFTSRKCTTGDRSFMGKFTSDYGAIGDYFLTTNSNSPYARG